MIQDTKFTKWLSRCILSKPTPKCEVLDVFFIHVNQHLEEYIEMGTVAEEPLFNKGFDEIEMLDIGETSSDVESISKSSIPSGLGSEASEPLVLKDWLSSTKSLQFHFDKSEYKDSLTEQSEFSKLYTEYTNSLFKILEQLNNVELRNPEEMEIEEPIGLITSGSIDAKTKLEQENNTKLNDSFLSLSELLISFIKNLQEIDAPEVENFECVLSILDCLHANVFYSEANLRPNLLSKWINRFDPKPDSELVEDIMLDTKKPYRHPLFWGSMISKLITRGLLDQAASAIRNSGFEELNESDSGLFRVIEDFINLLESYNSMSLKNQFAQWKLSCCEFRDIAPRLKESIDSSDNLLLFEQIHNLVFILTGLPKTIADSCDSWYEVITSLSLYQVRDDDAIYPQYLEVALSEKPPILIESDDVIKTTERAFLNIFEGSYLHALTRIDEVDSGMSAIVSRLLELKGLLINYYTLDESKSFDELMKGKTISEYMVTKFAFQCLNNHRLVPVGIGILLNENIASSQQSIENNQKIVQEYLPKYQCQSNDDLEWCLTICAKIGLVTTASELYRQYGSKSLKEGYLYEALNMLVNCYNSEGNQQANQKGIKEVHYIVWDLIFQDSLVNNRPINDELINNIVEHTVDIGFDVHPIIKQCLAPYAVLFEFYKSASKEVSSTTEPIIAKSKISRILHLLEFIHLPKKFVPLLLAQLLPFFLDDIYKFQIPDLIVMIELIDNFELSTSDEELNKAEELYKYSVENIEDSDQTFDWRKIVQKHGRSVPKSVQELLRTLRNEIASKTGSIYIDNL